MLYYLIDIGQEFLIRREEQHLPGIADRDIIISFLAASSYFVSDNTDEKGSANTLYETELITQRRTDYT